VQTPCRGKREVRFAAPALLFPNPLLFLFPPIVCHSEKDEEQEKEQS
jgi:hypothetical protein